MYRRFGREEYWRRFEQYASADAISADDEMSLDGVLYVEVA